MLAVLWVAQVSPLSPMKAPRRVMSKELRIAARESQLLRGQAAAMYLVFPKAQFKVCAQLWGKAALGQLPWQQMDVRGDGGSTFD